MGVKIKANIPYGSSYNFSNIGKANAKVLPLPVFAAPMQSLPSRIFGMQFCWMGVGFLTPVTKNTEIFVLFT